MHSEAESLSAEDLSQRRREGTPLEFGHTLEDLIGGQIDSGFVIVGFYKDRYSQEDHDLLGHYMSTSMATRAYKSGTDEKDAGPLAATDADNSHR